MKPYLFLCLTVVLACLTTQSWAQPTEGNPKQGEKVEALRIAYITEKLQLTAAEAQVFWPIFNEHQAKVKSIRQKAKDENISDDAPDAALEKAILTHFEVEQQVLNLQKDFFVAN